MRAALIFGLLLLLGTIFALHDGREPRLAIEDTTLMHKAEVTQQLCVPLEPPEPDAPLLEPPMPNIDRDGGVQDGGYA